MFDPMGSDYIVGVYKSAPLSSRGLAITLGIRICFRSDRCRPFRPNFVSIFGEVRTYALHCLSNIKTKTYNSIEVPVVL